MTTFETIMIICAVLIVLLVGFIAHRVTTIWDANNFIHIEIKKVLNDIGDDVASIKEEVGQTNARIDGFIPAVKHIRQQLDNIHQRQPCIDWDKLSKEQQDEFLKRLICPNYDSPFQPPFNPTCEMQGFTATGICQECNGKTICKHYDVNRTRCFVADTETTNNEK